MQKQPLDQEELMRFTRRTAHEGEPTHKTYELRTETLMDILMNVPHERIPQCMREIGESVHHLAALVEGMRIAGIPDDAIRGGVSLPPTLPWVDDGKAEVGFRVQVRDER